MHPDRAAIEAMIQTLLAGGKVDALAMGGVVTGVLAKYDGELVTCAACRGTGRRPDDATVPCLPCGGRGHMNGDPVELLRVVEGRLVEHLVHGQSLPLLPQED